MKFITAMLIIMAMLAPQLQAQQPQLTELDRLRIENLNLKIGWSQAVKQLNQCVVEKGSLQDQATDRQLQEDLKAVVEAIEAAHPGFTFDPATGQFAKKEPAKDERKK